MNTPSESLPKDLAAAHAMILAERAAREVERTARLTAEAAVAKAHTDRIVLDLELERLRFQLAKARREAFGQSSEAGARIGQFELALEDVEVALAAIEAAAAMTMRRAELQEDLTAWRVRPVIFVPAPVEAEALRQAAATIRLFDAALPAATLVFVENQRDGRIADLKASSEAAVVFHEDVLPVLGDRPRLVMPLIEGDACRSCSTRCMLSAPSKGSKT